MFISIGNFINLGCHSKGNYLLQEQSPACMKDICFVYRTGSCLGFKKERVR